MADRCPYCSFDPTSDSDFCSTHRNAAPAAHQETPEPTCRCGHVLESHLNAAAMQHCRECACRAFEEAAPARAAEWQPIETAPKDGTTIVLFGEGQVTVGGWVSAADQGAEPEEEFLISAGWWTLYYLRENAPTLWQPLPLPPGALAGDSNSKK